MWLALCGGLLFIFYNSASSSQAGSINKGWTTHGQLWWILQDAAAALTALLTGISLWMLHRLFHTD